MIYKQKKTGKKTSQLLMSGLLCGLLMSSALKAMEEKEGNNENHSGVVAVRHNEPTDLQAILTRLNLMSSTISTLTQQVEELSVENRSLNEKVEQLSNRMDAPSCPFFATLYNDLPGEWKFYPKLEGWHAMTFNRFEGDERLKDGQNLSYLMVPENGEYRIVATYNFLSHPTALSKPWVGIAIDQPTSVETYFATHMPSGKTHVTGSLETKLRLATGQKVFMSTLNEVDTQYYLKSFKIKVQKMN